MSGYQRVVYQAAADNCLAPKARYNAPLSHLLDKLASIVVAVMLLFASVNVSVFLVLRGLAARAHVSDEHGLLLTSTGWRSVLVNNTIETDGRALHGHHYPLFWGDAGVDCGMGTWCRNTEPLWHIVIMRAHGGGCDGEKSLTAGTCEIPRAHAAKLQHLTSVFGKTRGAGVVRGETSEDVDDRAISIFSRFILFLHRIREASKGTAWRRYTHWFHCSFSSRCHGFRLLLKVYLHEGKESTLHGMRALHGRCRQVGVADPQLRSLCRCLSRVKTGCQGGHLLPVAVPISSTERSLRHLSSATHMNRLSTTQMDGHAQSRIPGSCTAHHPRCYTCTCG
jgi:hypothetical protein